MKKVSHLGYYGLYRECEGRHFIGHLHPVIGCLTKEITKEDATSLIEPMGWEGWTDEQIKSFENASLSHLLALLD